MEIRRNKFTVAHTLLLRPGSSRGTLVVHSTPPLRAPSNQPPGRILRDNAKKTAVRGMCAVAESAAIPRAHLVTEMHLALAGGGARLISLLGAQ